VADARTAKRDVKSRSASGRSAPRGEAQNGKASKGGKSGKGAARSRESLSQDAIVEAALTIISRKGVDALNMRALAEGLGVSAMAAYYYVANKEDLLSLCGDAVYERVTVPSEDEGAWDERLRVLMVRQREAMRPYPGLREALTGVDMEHRRRLEDAEFDILLDAGFTAAQAVPAFRTLLSWTLGNAAIESSLRDPSSRRPEERWTKAQRLSFDRKRKPVMNADDYFNLGLDMVIAGLRGFLEHGGSKATASRRKASSRSKAR
jgi:TetR/AcrR family tetracycline transcriptional repressor